MKRLTIVAMAIIMMVCSTLGVSAEEMTGNTYQIDNITVVFETDSQFSVEQQEVIAQILVNSEYGVSRANLICNIFGHKNTQESVTTITHKEKATSPRCFQEIFTITTCSRCDESTVERIGFCYTTCCPED